MSEKFEQAVRATLVSTFKLELHCARTGHRAATVYYSRKYRIPLTPWFLQLRRRWYTWCGDCRKNGEAVVMEIIRGEQEKIK